MTTTSLGDRSSLSMTSSSVELYTVKNVSEARQEHISSIAAALSRPPTSCLYNSQVLDDAVRQTVEWSPTRIDAVDAARCSASDKPLLGADWLPTALD